MSAKIIALIISANWALNMHKIRIIGGSLRSRLIEVRDDVPNLRPTPNRVRQKLFDWLGQDLTGKICLDLFAGSGALGFEAFSRGAKMVYMVENNRQAWQQLHVNAKKLAVTNLHIMLQNGLDYLQKMEQMAQTVDVIFLDPPYASNLLAQSLAHIRANPYCAKAIIYIEYQTCPNLDGYTIVKQAKASTVSYNLLRLEDK